MSRAGSQQALNGTMHSIQMGIVLSMIGYPVRNGKRCFDKGRGGVKVMVVVVVVVGGSCVCMWGLYRHLFYLDFA